MATISCGFPILFEDVQLYMAHSLLLDNTLASSISLSFRFELIMVNNCKLNTKFFLCQTQILNYLHLWFYTLCSFKWTSIISITPTIRTSVFKFLNHVDTQQFEKASLNCEYGCVYGYTSRANPRISPAQPHLPLLKMNARHSEELPTKRETNPSTCSPGLDGMVCEVVGGVLGVSWLLAHPVLQGQRLLRPAKPFAVW